MCVLLASNAPEALAAIDLFIYRIAVEIGGLLSALGRVDPLVFTAAIGEHSPATRSAICTRLAWLGLRLDTMVNVSAAESIEVADSNVAVRAVAIDEEAIIALHASAMMHASIRPMEAVYG